MTIPVLSSAEPAHVEATCQQLGLDVHEFRELHRQCTAASASAYCPYSQFPVGAALLTRYGIKGLSSSTSNGLPGHFIVGANIEVASYPVGTCAERVALGRAVFEGHRDFKALAVTCPAGPVDTPSSPCGMCRQFIREFCDLDMPVLMFSKNGNYQAVRLETLLPLSFGPENLPR